MKCKNAAATLLIALGLDKFRPCIAGDEGHLGDHVYQPRIGNQLRMLPDARTPGEIINEAKTLKAQGLI